MGFSKLREKVKEHQEKVIKSLCDSFETDLNIVYKILTPDVLHTHAVSQCGEDSWKQPRGVDGEC
jgi:hypothetical protein